MKAQPGDVVGSRRWPDDGRAPWKGVVLNHDDPRAWAGTFAFPEAKPNRNAVKAHVGWCVDQWGDAFYNNIPVLWDFGLDGHVRHWESFVQPYDVDVAQCAIHRAEREARAEAQHRENVTRREDARCEANRLAELAAGDARRSAA